jgi:uncharacterized protein YdaU (DUF1376 family)
MMMPWYPRDFASSTRGWPLIARAVYRELLDAQWDLGRLPADPKRLQAIAGASDEEWSIAWPEIESKFPLVETSRQNSKLEEHRSKSHDLYEKRAQGARTVNAQRDGVRDAVRPAVRDGERAHPSPSPSCLLTEAKDGEETPSTKKVRRPSPEEEATENRKKVIREYIVKFPQYRDAPSTLSMLCKEPVEEVKKELELMFAEIGKANLFTNQLAAHLTRS